MHNYLTLALILSTGSVVMAAETPEPVKLTRKDMTPEWFAKQEAMERLGRQRTLAREGVARSVRDMANWDFCLVRRNPRWVIAEITVPNRKVYAPPRKGEGDDEFIPSERHGTIKVLAPLSAVPEKTEWPFFLSINPKIVAEGAEAPTGLPYERGTETGERYSPFFIGPASDRPRNLVLYLLPELGKGGLKLETANPFLNRSYLITETSLPYVVPAQTFYLANPELFSSENAAKNRERLLEQLESENLFLFAAATRTLAQSGYLSSETISKRLLKFDSFRQAVFVYSAMYYSPEAQGKAIVEEIEKITGEATDNAQLDGLIIGADCAFRTALRLGDPKIFTGIGHFETIPRTPQPLLISWSLFDTLAAKQQALGIHDETDYYLAGLLQRGVATRLLHLPAPVLNRGPVF